MAHDVLLAPAEGAEEGAAVDTEPRLERGGVGGAGSDVVVAAAAAVVVSVVAAIVTATVVEVEASPRLVGPFRLLRRDPICI